MAQKKINYGAAPNDGTGDLYRVAMIKIDDNFTDLYSITKGLEDNKVAKTATLALSGGATSAATALTGAATVITVTGLNMGNATAGTLAVARGGTGVTTSTGTGANVQAVSPALAGTPTTPLPGAGAADAQVANVKYVKDGLSFKANAADVTTALALKADKAYVDTNLALKVDKDGNKVLSDNNFTNAERQKLEGIAAGAQVNAPTNLALGAATANSRTITSSTGSSVTLPAASSSTAGLMTSAESTKLGTVAPNASANSSDSFLLNRANHTGTQDMGSLTGILPIAKGGTGQTSKLGIVNDLKAAQQQHLNGSVTPVSLEAGKEYSVYSPVANPIYEGVLPSAPNIGDTIVFHNGWGTWSTGRFTLSRGNANHTINGLKESVTFNTDAVRKVTLTYVWGDIWRLYCEV